MDLGDYPHEYEKAFSAVACDLSSLVFPSFITTPIITLFATIVVPLHKDWLLEEYLPVIVEATKKNKIPMNKRLGLMVKFWGVMIKILYAFLYQEEFLPVPGFRSHPFIWVGGNLIPYVYMIADSLTGFE